MSIGMIERLGVNNIEYTTDPDSSIRVVHADWSRTPGRKYPLVAMVGYKEKTKLEAKTRRFEWRVERTMKAVVTLDDTFSTSATELPLSDETIHLVGINQLLFNGDEVMQVVSLANISNGTVTVNRARWGTSAEAAVSGDEFEVGPQTVAAGGHFEEGPKQWGSWLYNYPMIFQNKISADMMAEAYTNYMVPGTNIMAHHEERLKELNLKQLEHQLMLGVSANPADYGEMGSFGGIMSFLTANDSNRIDLTGKLTPTGVVDLMEMMYDELGDLSGLTFLAGYESMRLWDATMASLNVKAGQKEAAVAGLHNMVYDTRYGQAKVQLLPSMREGKLAALNFSDMAMLPIDVGPFGVGWIEFDRGVENLGVRSREKGFGGVFTFKLGDPKKHGLLTFTETSRNAYANFE